MKTERVEFELEIMLAYKNVPISEKVREKKNVMADDTKYDFPYGANSLQFMYSLHYFMQPCKYTGC